MRYDKHKQLTTCSSSPQTARMNHHNAKKMKPTEVNQSPKAKIDTEI